jgi:transcriptional regulator with XRE-family HTH domain
MIKGRFIIKELREVRKLTQEELAKKNGLARLQIIKLETGQNKLTIDKFISLCRSMDYNVELKLLSRTQDEIGHYPDFEYKSN